MNEHFVSRLAIYLLSLVMIVFGIFHFVQPKMMLVYVPDFMPGGILWVYLTGAAFILAALAFITNRMVKLAGYLLAVMLLVFVLTVHLPNYLNSGDVELQQQALVSLLKDTALLGFALFIAANARHQRITEAADEPRGATVMSLHGEPVESI